MPTILRPTTDEHVPYYAKYIALVPDGDLLDLLRTQQQEIARLLRGLSDEQASHAYAPGKWTVKEVVGHLSDTERVFAYRMLRFSRGDATPVPGFDENVYTPAGHFNARTMDDLVDEFEAVRAATIHLLRPMSAEDLARLGTANSAPISVRALAYIAAGHERHHVAILRERYGV